MVRTLKLTERKKEEKKESRKKNPVQTNKLFVRINLGLYLKYRYFPFLPFSCFKIVFVVYY